MRMIIKDNDNGKAYMYKSGSGSAYCFTELIIENDDYQEVGITTLTRNELRKMDGGQDFIDFIDLTERCADVEVYESSDGSNRIHTDYMRSVETVEMWKRYIVKYEVMNESEYNCTVLANAENANFEEWYDDEDAEVLVVMVGAEA